MKKFLLSSLLPVAGAAALAWSAPAASGPPALGTMAPEFSLQTNAGAAASLKDYRGKWVVLYFYPKDFTSGCTLEAHNFERDRAKYDQAGAVILGVSVDSADSHKSFCSKEGLGFTLLSDPGGKVSTAYGSVMEHEGTTYSARNTFVIDPQGKIARVFLKVDPAGHSDEVLRALAEMQKTPAPKAAQPS
jgi:thioredoxin-dependent peroxiredoxin